VTTWVSLMTFLFVSPPPPSPSQGPPCQWVADGDALRVTTKTLVYVHPLCPDVPMTREAMVEAMACEDRSRALALQVRRLLPRFAEEGITIAHCPPGVRVGIESEGGTLKSVPLGETRKFFGTVILAPKRRPARLLGQITDEELLRLLKEYFR
jgi:hypothetical protein